MINEEKIKLLILAIKDLHSINLKLETKIAVLEKQFMMYKKSSTKDVYEQRQISIEFEKMEKLHKEIAKENLHLKFCINRLLNDNIKNGNIIENNVEENDIAELNSQYEMNNYPPVANENENENENLDVYGENPGAFDITGVWNILKS